MGQYKTSLHLPHVVFENGERKKKKFGKGRNRNRVDRIENDFGTRFTIYSTGLA